MTTATSPNGTVHTLDEVNAAAAAIWSLIYDQGQLTKDEIRAGCKAAGLDTVLYQKGFARLANQVKSITEVSRDDGSKAYELKRHARLVGTYSDFVALMEETNAPAKPRERFGDWYGMAGTFMLTSPCLSSRPVVGNPSARCFIRDWEGNLLMPAGVYAAMFEEACGKPVVPDVGSARYRVEWDQQAVDPSLLVTILNPVPPSRPGGSGQGLTEIEALPAGTRIPWAATIPLSHITPMDFAKVLAAAGRWCGFSPSAHKQGWGRFQPEFDAESTALIQESGTTLAALELDADLGA